ncbi:MAG: molybdopterin molybdotransferase [Solirubrobacteraceae bacterium]|nr:molybdopterin molybdotransferase [Solirubrobacteraceae bacterium]
MPDLLTIDEARALVLATVTPLDAEERPIAAALGRVLAEDVAAAHDVPSFANSAMDGFAVRSGPAGRELRVVGESRAGTPAELPVHEDEAVRISTGAAVPDGADAILPVEDAEERGETVVPRIDLAAGHHVRGPGEDLRAGSVVLRAGTALGPAELGLAVEAGRATLRVARAPRVAVLATGDELVAPGEPLRHGQLHNSNAVTLAALARDTGAELVSTSEVRDDAQATRAAIELALDGSDVVLLTGGVSVGPHDHVKPALSALGVEEVFWRVALRPGKPLWFGRRGAQLVFGLPGNPVSAMVCFLLFARPALRAMQGAPAAPSRTRAVLGAPVARQRGREEAVRVRIDDGRVLPTGPQGSHQLHSMLGADALAIVPRGEGELPAGAEVDIEPI